MYNNLFRIKLVIGANEYIVNPAFSSDASIEASRGAGFTLKAEKISASLTFYDQDFQLINGLNINQRAEIVFERRQGADYVERYRTFFGKIDCTDIDADKRYAVLSLQSNDRYSKILSGRSKKFNVLEVPPKRTPVKYSRFPIFQVYILGEDLLTNITNTNSWEQDVVATNDAIALVDTYFFNESAKIHYIPGSGVLNPDISGRYFENSGTGNYENGQFRIQLNGAATAWEVIDILNGGVVLYNGALGQLDINATVFTPVSGLANARLFTRRLFTRVLTNRGTINGNTTSSIPEDDIVSHSGAYQFVAPVSISSTFGSDANSVDPTGFKQFGDTASFFQNLFFEYPVDQTINENFLPIAPTNWEDFSMWVYYNSSMEAINADGKEELQVQDAYQFSDILTALLKKLDDSVLFRADPTGSDFLYNPSNPVRGIGEELTTILVPKSNVLAGDYTKPASRADFSFNDIEELLKLWNCDWWIDEDNYFRVEHRKYFEGGGTYNGIQVSTDLNGLREAHTGQPVVAWENKWRYDKAAIPERIEMEWAEKGSPPFNGFPIESVSEFAEIGNVEKMTASAYFPDIDFAMHAGEEVGETGFFLFECTRAGSDYVVPIISLQLGALKGYRLQNGYASMIYIQDRYHRHGLPVNRMRINQAVTIASSVRKNKIQEVAFAGTDEFNYLHLATTQLGNGEIDTVKLNLTSGALSLTLRHETT